MDHLRNEDNTTALVSQLNLKSSEFPPEIKAGFHSIFEPRGSNVFTMPTVKATCNNAASNHIK